MSEENKSETLGFSEEKPELAENPMGDPHLEPEKESVAAYDSDVDPLNAIGTSLGYKVSSTFVACEPLRETSLIAKIFKILDPWETLQGKFFICGGFARFALSSVAKPVKPGDIDIYSQDSETFESLKANILKAGKFTEIASSAAAVSYKDESLFFGIPYKLQIIKPIIQGNIVLSGSVEDVLNAFDFTIARAAILSENSALKDADFDADDAKKRLHIKAIHCPIAEVYRVSKYMKKGYFCPLASILQIFIDWESRPKSYRLKLVEMANAEALSQDEILHLEALLHID